MQIVHSHKFLGTEEDDPITETVLWNEIVTSLLDMIMDASAWNTYHSGGEYSVEFVYADLDEVFKTRIVGTAKEMIPFYRIMMLLLEVKDDWRKDWPTLFLSVCTYVVRKAQVSTYTNLTPDPMPWDELKWAILPILTGKKVWLH